MSFNAVLERIRIAKVDNPKLVIILNYQNDQ
jgi:hypothetical protein